MYSLRATRHPSSVVAVPRGYHKREVGRSLRIHAVPHDEERNGALPNPKRFVLVWCLCVHLFARTPYPIFSILPCSHNMPVSLFMPFSKLPPKGKSLTPEQESCDVNEKFCDTPVHVWEVKCVVCFGTGATRSCGKKFNKMGMCLRCHGVGYIRHASSQTIPDPGNADTGHSTEVGR